MTALRDNAIYVREWLGASYYGGAIKDHNHDGGNSARLEVGPNYLRNCSFEGGESGWTFTDYAGGSHALNAAQRIHGQQSAAFTSTVLANGGGEAICNEYLYSGAGQPYALSAWVWASVANVSSKIQIVYYDWGHVPISTVDLMVQTNTPTSATRITAQDSPPSQTSFARIRIIGGVPASGAAVGTVYFDNIVLSNPAYQLAIENAAVGRAQLKSTTGSGSIGFSTAPATYSLAGGTYAWWTASAATAAASFGNSDTAAGNIGIVGTAGGTFYVDERYIQASPPYDLGNGEVPLFVWALVDRSGAIRGTQVAPDPTWAYHGPTNITPQFWRGDRPFRRYPKAAGRALDCALRDRDLMTRILERQVPIEWIEREITQEIKNADMVAFPHPFTANDLSDCTVVLLDPVGGLCERLQAIQADQGARSVRDLLLSDYLRLDNQPLDCVTPPGVTAVRAKFLDTADAGSAVVDTGDC
jgi:hypothetical protein